MLIHDLPVSFVETLGAKQNWVFKKWSGVSRFTTPSVFYRTPKNHGWNMKEMVPFYQKQQLIRCHLLKTSSDPDVRRLYESRCQTERKKRLSANPAERVAWSPTIELDSCIQAAEHRKRAGKANHGSQGLGLHEVHRNRKTDSKQAEERHAALEEFATKTEEGRYQHCLQLAAWGEWTKWDNVMEQDRDWQKLIMQRDDTLFRFQIGALEDTLPTPSVLHHWYSKDGNAGGIDPTCKLCRKAQCSLKHILVAVNVRSHKTGIRGVMIRCSSESIKLFVHSATKAAKNSKMQCQ